jgi:hypothetical protein
MNVNFGDFDGFRRWDVIKPFSDAKYNFTVVRVKVENGAHTATVKRIKWTKYKFINWFIRLWIKIRYYQPKTIKGETN